MSSLRCVVPLGLLLGALALWGEHRVLHAAEQHGREVRAAHATAAVADLRLDRYRLRPDPTCGWSRSPRPGVRCWRSTDGPEATLRHLRRVLQASRPTCLDDPPGLDLRRSCSIEWRLDGGLAAATAFGSPVDDTLVLVAAYDPSAQ
jgi:hypothetical protein